MTSAPTSRPPLATSETIDQLLGVAQQRLRELQPVAVEIAAEITQLNRVIAVLSQPGADEQIPELTALLAGTTPSFAEGIQVPGQRRLSPRPGRDGRAPQGANKQLILETVRHHPGVRSADIARLTGLKQTVVSATVNRLKRQGCLELTADKGLRIPDDAVA